jgi:hypothetical protein
LVGELARWLWLPNFDGGGVVIGWFLLVATAQGWGNRLVGLVHSGLGMTASSQFSMKSKIWKSLMEIAYALNLGVVLLEILRS